MRLSIRKLRVLDFNKKIALLKKDVNKSYNKLATSSKKNKKKIAKKILLDGTIENSYKANLKTKQFEELLVNKTPHLLFCKIMKPLVLLMSLLVITAVI